MRSAVNDHAGRLVEATQRWSRSDRDLELATTRFERTNRTLANSVEQAVTPATENHRIVVSPYQYPTATPAVRSVAMHDRNDDLEPEMEKDF